MKIDGFLVNGFEVKQDEEYAADDWVFDSFPLLWKKLRNMLCESKTSTEAVGLGIHPDKTKILSNQDKMKAKETTVDNIKIEILAKEEGARYLGQ